MVTFTIEETARGWLPRVRKDGHEEEWAPQPSRLAALDIVAKWFPDALYRPVSTWLAEQPVPRAIPPPPRTRHLIARTGHRGWKRVTNWPPFVALSIYEIGPVGTRWPYKDGQPPVNNPSSLRRGWSRRRGDRVLTKQEAT
jgi:hypothetical protein